MEKGYNLTNKRLRGMTQIGVMAALTFLATWLLNVPYAVNGVVHMGDTVIFVSAILLGPKKAAVSSALGMTLFDILSPYAIWAPFTFVIKGVMGLIAGTIAYRNGFKGRNILNNVIAFVTAGIWMIAGYYVAAAILATSLLGGSEASFKDALIVSLPKIPGDIIQVVGGIVVALPIIILLKKAKLIDKLSGV